MKKVKVRRKRKMISALVLSFSLGLSLVPSLGYANAAPEESSKLELPMTLFDVNADNLFFEYAMDSGMRFSPENDVPATGLTESKLDGNGLPVYTQASVEEAARLIGKTLIKDDFKSDIFSTLKEKLITEPGTNEEQLQYMLGATTDGNYFYDCGWNTDVESYKMNDALVSENYAELWKQNGDGILNLGNDDIITLQYFLESPGNYKFEWWSDVGNGTITIDDYSTGLVNSGWQDYEFTIDEEKEITVTIRGNRSRVAALKLCKENDVPDNDVLLTGNGSAPYFYELGWKSQNSSAKTENGLMYTGDIFFQQNGDGIISFGAAADLWREIPVVGGTDYEIGYYIGENGQYGGLDFEVQDADGNKLLEINGSEMGIGEYTAELLVPENTDKIKIVIKGKEGETGRLAALSLTPMKSYKYNLGTYAQTEQKYKNGNLKKLDDVETGMDYAYLRMKEMFDENSSFHSIDSRYNKLVLTLQNGKYIFTSDAPVKYDGDQKAILNDTTMPQSVGFFPVDGKEGGELTHSEVFDEDHNYHFGMKVSGVFHYEPGLYFDFSGDDDVYLFINNKLALDLGGAHGRADGRISLDEKAEELGLELGRDYSFNFFYLERHTDASNLKVETNIKVISNEENEKQDYIKKQVKKIWNDKGHEEDRPNSIVIELYQDNKKIDQIELENGADHVWDEEELSYSFENLPKYSDLENKTEYKYEIKEVMKNSVYEVSYRVEGDTTYVTNKYPGSSDSEEETPSTPEETPSEPETPSTPEETPSEPETPSTPEETPSEPETPSTPEETPSEPETPSTPEETPSEPETPSTPEEKPSTPEEASGVSNEQPVVPGNSSEGSSDEGNSRQSVTEASIRTAESMSEVILDAPQNNPDSADNGHKGVNTGDSISAFLIGILIAASFVSASAIGYIIFQNKKRKRRKR